MNKRIIILLLLATLLGSLPVVAQNGIQFIYEEVGGQKVQKGIKYDGKIFRSQSELYQYQEAQMFGKNGFRGRSRNRGSGRKKGGDMSNFEREYMKQVREQEERMRKADAEAQRFANSSSQQLNTVVSEASYNQHIGTELMLDRAEASMDRRRAEIEHAGYTTSRPKGSSAKPRSSTLNRSRMLQALNNTETEDQNPEITPDITRALVDILWIRYWSSEGGSRLWGYIYNIEDFETKCRQMWERWKSFDLKAEIAKSLKNELTLRTKGKIVSHLPGSLERPLDATEMMYDITTGNLLFKRGNGKLLIDLATEGSPRQVKKFLIEIEQGQKRDLKTIQAKIEGKAGVPIGSLSIRSGRDALNVAEKQMSKATSKAASQKAEEKGKEIGTKMVDSYFLQK